MTDILDLIAADPGVKPEFAQLFREPCWACSGGMRPPAYGKCTQCGGKGLVATERVRA